jgi:serine/threonine protein kinase
MPAPATRDEFLDVVRKSGVLDDESINSFARAAQDSGVSLGEPVSVAQRMIRDGLLTSYQAKQLLQGKYRRFLVGGKYKLLEPLGAGGMGQVFLCRHIYMNRLVALKVLPIDKLKDPSMLERFYREARAAAALDHPNIVRAYDIDHDEGLEEGRGTLHYLVMEFVDGASLQELIARRGPMDPVRAAHYMRQAALGLEHAHEAGLVHRDVKPGNLLLDRAGTVKVLDLGLARFFEAGKESVTERYDEKNAILGTADYLAPEQARGETVDIRADVYSLGATFYFLLTGKAPFEEGTITQKLLWSQTKAPKPVLERRPDVPTEIIAVIDRMMAKDAKDRYQTPAAVAEALSPWTQTPIAPPAADEMPRRSLAALSPGSPSQVLLPSTPTPRTVPSDLIRRTTASGATPAVRTGPKTPAPTTNGPMTPVPATGPRSRQLTPVESTPRPEPRRKTGRSRNKGLPRWVIFAAAGTGAVLVIVGLFVGWAIKRSRHSSSTEPVVVAVPAPAIVLPGDAGKYLEQRCTIEMTVARTVKDKAGTKFTLHSKQKATDADNFTVSFNKKVLDQFAGKGIASVEVFKGKTIRVTGTVKAIQNKPQIVVESADQIQLIR